MSRNIDSRLKKVLYQLGAYLSDYKTFLFKTKNEENAIMEKENNSIINNSLIEVKNIVVMVDCTEYDGKHKIQ